MHPGLWTLHRRRHEPGPVRFCVGGRRRGGGGRCGVDGRDVSKEVGKKVRLQSEVVRGGHLRSGCPPGVEAGDELSKK